MTPPPAASHAAHPNPLALRPAAVGGRSVSLNRLLAARSWSRLRLVLDIVVLYLASSAALFFAVTPIGAAGSDRLIAAAFPLIVLATLHLRRGADDRLGASWLDAGAAAVSAVAFSAMLMIALESVLGASHPVGLALRLWLFSSVYLGGARIMLRSIRSQAAVSRALATDTVVVGAGMVGEHVVKRLIAEPRYGLRPVGFLDSDPLHKPGTETTRSVPVLGGPEDLIDVLERTGARQVILAFSSEPDHVLVEHVRECQRRGVEVALVPRLYEAINERSTIEHVGGLPLVSLRSVDPRGWQFAVKHGLDRCFALLALLALAPAMAAIGLMIRLTSPGPMLFRQRRVGRDGRVFDLLKFRTMRAPGAAERFAPPAGMGPGGIEGVDRRTRIGRLLRDSSLDELPQFINVLRGDMSLVGPRPERPEFVELFSSEFERYEDRHRVRAGITGWAQVHGLRGRTSIADRTEWDNHYILNWSLWLDLKILALTFAEVMRLRQDS